LTTRFSVRNHQQLLNVSVRIEVTAQWYGVSADVGFNEHLLGNFMPPAHRHGTAEVRDEPQIIGSSDFDRLLGFGFDSYLLDESFGVVGQPGCHHRSKLCPCCETRHRATHTTERNEITFRTVYLDSVIGVHFNPARQPWGEAGSAKLATVQADEPVMVREDQLIRNIAGWY
jgi:hypothetical protein